jgi:hypothetical protein
MIRYVLLALVSVALLLPAVGCKKAGSGDGQPRLANPDDPRVKGLEPARVGGGGGSANPGVIK